MAIINIDKGTNMDINGALLKAGLKNLFANNNNIKNITIQDPSAGTITDLSYLFGYTNVNNVVNITIDFNTSKVTNMSYICPYYFQNLQNISNFNTSNVINITGAFRSCYNLRNMPNFDWSNVVNAAEAFEAAGAMRIFNFPNSWTFPKLRNAQEMFRSCWELRGFPNINYAQLDDFGGIFVYCNYLTYGAISGSLTWPNFDLPNKSPKSNIRGLFAGWPPNEINKNLNYYNRCVETYPIIQTYGLFEGCFWSNELPNIDFSKSNDMQLAFYECININIVPNYNLCMATSFYYTFYNMRNIRSIPNFYCPNVHTLTSAFRGCVNLVDVPEWQFNNLNDSMALSSTFMFCNNLSINSIQNIINMCLNSNITSNRYKNLNTQNLYSPFYYTNITSSKYSNRLSELTAAGWTY